MLAGVDCVFSGPSPLLLVDGKEPPEVQLAPNPNPTPNSTPNPSPNPNPNPNPYPNPTPNPHPHPHQVQLARRFGVTLRAELAPTTTHLLVPPALLTAEGGVRCERTQRLQQRAEALG